MDDGSCVRVNCRDCSFEQVICEDDDAKPAEILVEHGQRTGHTLSVSRADDERSQEE